MVSKAQVVYNYLSMLDYCEKADAIFVLGNSSDGPIHEAAELYWEGYAPKIVFTSTGGTYGGNLIWDMPETEYYAQYLKNLSIVADTDFIYARSASDQTTNTLAEAKQAVSFMRKHGINPHKVLLVSRAVHQRRACLTFMKQNPDVEFFNCSDHEPLTGELIPRMIAEVERIQTYGAKGDLLLDEIPQKVLNACGALKSSLPK